LENKGVFTGGTAAIAIKLRILLSRMNEKCQ
jgi:hypothetical protein